MKGTNGGDPGDGGSSRGDGDEENGGNMSTLAVRIDNELRKELKVFAAKADITLQDLAQWFLRESLKTHTPDDVPPDLK